MSGSEAAELVGRIKGFFPMITQIQEDFFYERFLTREYTPTSRAIDRYAELRSDMVDRAQLMLLIDVETRRLAGNAAAMEQRRSTQKLREEVAAIDRFIERLPASELDRLKREVLAGLPEGYVRSRLEKADPRHSATLKGLIYERARGKAAVAA